MFGKKKTHGTDHDHKSEIGSPATKKGRSLLLLSCLLGLIGTILLIIGAAMLQHRLKSALVRGLSSDALSDSLNGGYNDAFQSAHYTPYPDSRTRQWQFVWFLIAASIFVFVLTLLIAASAVRIVQWTPTLIGLHVYVLVYCTLAIDTFLWINHNKTLRDTVFGKKRIAITLAGLFTMAIAHGLAILAMGLIPNKRHIDNRYVHGGVTERIIEKQIEVPVPAPTSSDHHRDSHHDSHSDTHFKRKETPVFTNNPAQPVHVRQGGARLTDAHPSGTEPVQVHLGGVSNPVGTTELGSNRY